MINLRIIDLKLKEILLKQYSQINSNWKRGASFLAIIMRLTKLLIVITIVITQMDSKVILNETVTQIPNREAAAKRKKIEPWEVVNSECHEQVFDQPVFIEGCSDVTIQNRRCLGVCNSYYDPLMKNFQMCFSCLPNVQPFHMTVRCVGAGGNEISQQVKTDIVAGCKCSQVSCYAPDYL